MGSEVRAILGEMRSLRRERFAQLAQVPSEQLNLMTEWNRKPHEARFLLLHVADHEQEHAMHMDRLLQAAGYRQTIAQQLLGAAEETRGALLGTLVGLGDADLDLAPAGEWPLRRTLQHIFNTEERYLASINYAVARFGAGLAWEPPAEGVVPPFLTDVPDDSYDALIARLDALRELVIEQLAELTNAQLRAPTVWANHAVDIDFRIRRITNHEREHTAHILKWRWQVGRAPSEVEHILSLAWRERGVLHGQLVGLDAEYLDREINPEMAEMTVRFLLQHLPHSEAYLLGQIFKAA